MDSKILETTGIANMGADIEDYWHVHGIVAPGLVIVAVISFNIFDMGIAYLPKHLDVFVVTDWHLTNLAHDFVIYPAT